MKQIFVVACSLVCLSVPCIADDVEATAFSIAIDVSVPDEGLQERVTQYLGAELELLGDVKVSSDSPDYKLFAVVMQVRTSADTRMAYVLGLSVVSYFPDRYLDYMLDSTLVNIDEVRKNMKEANIYENQFLSLAGPTEENLREVVASAVKKFDTHILRHIRNQRQVEAKPTS